MGDKLNINRLTAEAVELLKGMIAIPSPSFSEEEVCTHICGWLTEKGVAHERVGRNIIAEHIVDAAMPTLMMCAHIDTVNASPEYSFDPFLPDYEAAAKAIGAASGTDGCESEIVAGLGSNDDGAYQQHDAQSEENHARNRVKLICKEADHSASQGTAKYLK